MEAKFQHCSLILASGSKISALQPNFSIAAKIQQNTKIWAYAEARFKQRSKNTAWSQYMALKLNLSPEENSQPVEAQIKQLQHKISTCLQHDFSIVAKVQQGAMDSTSTISANFQHFFSDFSAKIQKFQPKGRRRKKSKVSANFKLKWSQLVAKCQHKFLTSNIRWDLGLGYHFGF